MHGPGSTPHDAAEDDDNGATVNEGTAGHGDHQVRLELLPTTPWATWRKRDKEWLDQQTFAEHIEDNLLDIVTPEPATMLEIAEHFHAASGVTFKSAQRLHSGQVTLNYEESTTARAGETGDMEIPTEFTISVAPFLGADPIAVSVRFRYRIRSGQLALSYALRNPDDVEEACFTTQADVVRGRVDEPVYLGRPA